MYASAFNDGLQFMAEDYIAGQEFSFETLLVDGQAHVVAVHEKYEVTETADTVLEDSCTTPPASLDQAQIAAGLHWLKNVLGCMDLKWGCYHVEARFTGQHWDLIEINPRVGGSLISHSVEAVTAGHSMLSLWLDLLWPAKTTPCPAKHSCNAWPNLAGRRTAAAHRPQRLFSGFISPNRER